MPEKNEMMRGRLCLPASEVCMCISLTNFGINSAEIAADFKVDHMAEKTQEAEHAPDRVGNI